MRFGYFILILLFTLGLGMSSQGQEPTLLDELKKMRMKQQDEEQVIRIQQFVNQQRETKCTPVELVRQRMKDIMDSQGKTTSENVNITAGHGELNVTDNHGTINSDIKVQIIKQGDERECP